MSDSNGENNKDFSWTKLSTDSPLKCRVSSPFSFHVDYVVDEYEKEIENTTNNLISSSADEQKREENGQMEISFMLDCSETTLKNPRVIFSSTDEVGMIVGQEIFQHGVSLETLEQMRDMFAGAVDVVTAHLEELKQKEIVAKDGERTLPFSERLKCQKWYFPS